MTTTATKTQRRTTKITQPRGYVAIEVDYVSAATTRIACVAKEAMHIEGTNGASVDLKAGEAFHLVRAESLSEQRGKAMFYVVREEIGVKKCSCPAAKPCKHEVRLAKHIAEHGRPAIHLRATEIAAETSKARAAQVAEAAPEPVVETANPARELRNAFRSGDYMPEYRDGDGNWQPFKDERGNAASFPGGLEDLAGKFIAVDTEEHRAAVLAEFQQMIDAANAAYEAEQARKAVQRQAESDRRMTSTLQGNRGFSLMAK